MNYKSSRKSEIQKPGRGYLEGFGEFFNSVYLYRGGMLALKTLDMLIGDLRFLSQLLLGPPMPFTEFPKSLAEFKTYLISHTPIRLNEIGQLYHHPSGEFLVDGKSLFLLE